MFEPDAWEADSDLVQAVCDEASADLFISSYYTRPTRTPSVMMVYDFIPEIVPGLDLSEPIWRQKHDAIRHAVAYACNSNNTLRDLRKHFSDTANKPATVISRGVGAQFSPPSKEEAMAFHERMVVPHLAGRRYLLYVGILSNYKNAELLLRVFAGMAEESRRQYGILFTTADPMVQMFQALPGLWRMPRCYPMQICASPTEAPNAWSTQACTRASACRLLKLWRADAR